MHFRIVIGHGNDERVKITDYTAKWSSYEMKRREKIEIILLCYIDFLTSFLRLVVSNIEPKQVNSTIKTVFSLDTLRLVNVVSIQNNEHGSRVKQSCVILVVHCTGHLVLPE